MIEDSLKQIDFSYIRYANCWEDANVLLKGLNPDKKSKILSIGSAGDNSFSLLIANPLKVTAIDINPAQTALIELKKVAIKYLEYEEVLCFLGFKKSDIRIDTFESIKRYLSKAAKLFWENHTNIISAGVVHQGKFEKYFQLFSKRILPLIHTKKVIRELITPKSADKQDEFYKEKWNTWRWRLLFHVFFSKAVMGKYGRDKNLFLQVKEPVSNSIFKRVEQHLKSEIPFKNEFLEYILFNEFSKTLPHYLEPLNFELIKQSIDKLEIVCDSFSSYFKVNSDYTHFNLSDIFEYLNEKDYRNLIELIDFKTSAKSKFAYWNLLVPRCLSTELPMAFKYLKTQSKELSEIDKGFFYAPLIIEEKK